MTEEVSPEHIMGYLHMLHHMAINDRNPKDPDDVKDTLLDFAVEFGLENPTDEQLEIEADAFYTTQRELSRQMESYKKASLA